MIWGSRMKSKVAWVAMGLILTCVAILGFSHSNLHLLASDPVWGECSSFRFGDQWTVTGPGGMYGLLETWVGYGSHPATVDTTLCLGRFQTTFHMPAYGTAFLLGTIVGSMGFLILHSIGNRLSHRAHVPNAPT